MVDNDEPDILDFSGMGNGILGAGNSESGSPLFFTVNQGLVSVTPTAQAAAAAAAATADTSSVSFNDSAAAAERASSRLSESLNLSVSKAGLDSLVSSESKSDQLKAAFLLFCKRNIVCALLCFYFYIE